MLDAARSVREFTTGVTQDEYLKDRKLQSFRAMTNWKDIRAEFSDKALSRGALSLLRPQDALSFVVRCREVGLRILGVDAFLVSSQHVQPSTEHSIDFSSEREDGLAEDSWDRAEVFLRKYEISPYLFEVVFEQDK